MSRKVEIVMPTDQNLSATDLIGSSKEIAPFSVLYSVPLPNPVHRPMICDSLTLWSR
jgi:hypothetical protein